MTAAVELESRGVVAGPTRVLLLAPTGRDAQVTAGILGRAGFDCEICPDVPALCERIDEGAGLAAIAAEGLAPVALRRIAQTLEAQPAWSEIPLLIFVAQPAMDRAVRSFEALGPRAHVTLIDRPVHVKTLISAARTALRSRMRQYEIRDLLEQLHQRVQERDELLERERDHARRLSGLTEASLAIASALSLEEVLQMITDQARKVMNAAFALTCMRVDENGATRNVLSLSCEPADNCWKDTFDEQARLILDQIAADLRGPLHVSGGDVAAHALNVVFGGRCQNGCLAAPLLEREGSTVGIIALAGTLDAGFTAEDQAVLTQLAQMASAAVQNARLYREAQEANRAKDDFLATLAHELRTPMTGILGWVQMLKMPDAQPEDFDTALQMIEGSTRVQVRIVEDLLDVSRIIARKLRIEMAAVELNPVVESVVETFRARAGEAKVKLTADLVTMPLSVYGDEARLHQVIWNLLSNAIKFTPEGGTVHVMLERAESKAIIRVSDTGSGIEPAFLPHVFERFRQADNTTTRQQAGLGLGLAIVRYLVDLHSGTVTASSDGRGKGSVFTVTLPVLAVRKDPSEPRERRGIPRLAGVNVLIVDDDVDAGNMVSEALTEFGAEASTVTSVSEAVEKLRSFSPDVIVSDIAMPGEDGYALMRRLRQMQGRPIPSLALTGYGRPEDRTRILSSGFQKYVQKPVSPSELAFSIADLVGRRQR
jgi:signal transduction histidine kinase